GNLTANTSYTVTGFGQGTQQDSRQLTITVNPAPDCAGSLSANPTSVSYNTASNLTWSTVNCTNVRLSGGSFNNDLVGISGASSTGNLFANTIYTLIGQGVNNNFSLQVTVTVGEACSITQFSANPTSVSYNTASNLTWSTVNCTSVTLS